LRPTLGVRTSCSKPLVLAGVFLKLRPGKLASRWRRLSLFFVQRIAVGGYRGFSTEIAGNLVLLAEVVGDHMRQALGWQESLQVAEKDSS
jgi:hypothetical protein